MKTKPRDRPLFTDAELGHYGLEVGVAGHHLTGCSAPLPLRPLPPPEWADLLVAVQREWIWRSLGAAVSDGALPCSAEQAAEARRGANTAALSDLRVEMQVVRTSQLLDDEGIEHRVLKGVTTALRVFTQPELRSFGDVDILVPGESFDATAAVLERAGGVRRFPSVRAGFDRRFSKGASFRMPGGVSVDLHRTFVLGPYGFTVDLDSIWSRGDAVTVAGTRIPCLELHDSAVHACMHAALGAWPPFLTSLRDVVEFLLCDAIEPDVVLSRASEWKVEAPVARAVSAAEAVYRVPHLPLAAWAASYRAKRWERRALEVYGQGHNFRSQAFAAVPFVPGVLPKLAYVRALAIPEADYLSEREGSYLRRVLRAAATPWFRSPRR